MSEATEHPPIGEAQTESAAAECPMVIRRPVEGGSNRDWWPNAVNLKILQKNPDVIDPNDEGFDYRGKPCRPSISMSWHAISMSC